MTRKATNRLYDLVDQGAVSLSQVMDMCMGAMSEDDVAAMLDANELSERFFEEEADGQPDEAQEWHDYDPDC